MLGHSCSHVSAPLSRQRGRWWGGYGGVVTRSFLGHRSSTSPHLREAWRREFWIPAGWTADSRAFSGAPSLRSHPLRLVLAPWGWGGAPPLPAELSSPMEVISSVWPPPHVRLQKD